MTWKVRTKERLGKYNGLSDQELAADIYARRYIHHEDWPPIAKEVGINKTRLLHILREQGYDTSYSTNGVIKNIARNQFILNTLNESHAAGIHLTDYAIAKRATDAGFKKVTPQVVYGVVVRARKAGIKVPSDADRKAAKPRCKAQKSGATGDGRIAAKQHPWRPQGTGKVFLVEPIPPRTPELLARGRVSWDDLRPFTCRYTPSEESPFLFCGEKAIPSESWCQDCKPLLVKPNERKYKDKIAA